MAGRHFVTRVINDPVPNTIVVAYLRWSSERAQLPTPFLIQSSLPSSYVRVWTELVLSVVISALLLKHWIKWHWRPPYSYARNWAWVWLRCRVWSANEAKVGVAALPSEIWKFKLKIKGVKGTIIITDLRNMKKVGFKCEGKLDSLELYGGKLVRAWSCIQCPLPPHMNSSKSFFRSMYAWKCEDHLAPDPFEGWFI